MDVRLGGDIFCLPFQRNSVDGVWNVGVMEHFTHDQIDQIMREFHRVLKPKGQFVITTPNYRSLWPAIEFFMNTLHLVPKVPGGDHISKYHWRTVEGALTAAGFMISRMGTFNHLSPIVALLSDRWAERLYQHERGAARAGGHLLYALCERP